MTLHDRRLALLSDLIYEQAQYPAWDAYYARKIEEMWEAVQINDNKNI